MPEKVTQLDATRDPSVTAQYDSTSNPQQKLEDFYNITDSLPICIFSTYRAPLGPVGRSMAIAKRSGPDFLFLANANSQKFRDLEAYPNNVQLTFQDSKTWDWVSVAGKVTTMSSEDPRIKEIWSKGIAAWFGDVGDGVHDGGPEDPRMKLIEFKSTYITYWKRTTGALSFAKEIGLAILTGNVANTGVLREIGANDIQQARQSDSAFTN